MLKYQEKDTVTWFNIDGLHNTVLMKGIAAEFDFDQLILPDVMNTQARPTLIEYDNCIFISIKMLQQEPASRERRNAYEGRGRGFSLTTVTGLEKRILMGFEHKV